MVTVSRDRRYGVRFNSIQLLGRLRVYLILVCHVEKDQHFITTKTAQNMSDNLPEKYEYEEHHRDSNGLSSLLRLITEG